MPIDREAVERVLGLLAETDAAEIEIEDGETAIRVARSAPESGGVVASVGSELSTVEEVLETAEPTPAATEPVVVSEQDARSLEYVTAGLVGLFHRGPNPGDEPIVEVGDEVKEGQVVASIEALRKVTDVAAPIEGIIDEFFVVDGEAVQYGDRILAIRPREA